MQSPMCICDHNKEIHYFDKGVCFGSIEATDPYNNKTRCRCRKYLRKGSKHHKRYFTLLKQYKKLDYKLNKLV